MLRIGFLPFDWLRTGVAEFMPLVLSVLKGA